jgi:hypothetical protein
MTHIVAAPSALDAAAWPPDARVLRVAGDEMLVIPPPAELTLDDPYAIVVEESGFVGIWLPMNEATALLECACEWEPPTVRPAFAQGMVAGVPAKVWFESERVLFLVPAPYAQDFRERLS